MQYLLSPCICCCLLWHNPSLITLNHSKYRSLYIINHSMFFMSASITLQVRKPYSGNDHMVQVTSFSSPLCHTRKGYLSYVLEPSKGVNMFQSV